MRPEAGLIELGGAAKEAGARLAKINFTNQNEKALCALVMHTHMNRRFLCINYYNDRNIGGGSTICPPAPCQ